ncbi:hypothetical protein [Allorhizobium terrae]|uniref:Uncharacterized protein n=1 Tax=Allorhizobium terrae TaxID=1848972 RepID=A0A4S3ZYI4_9HYPH|nr:hypothetical protein [Allorhizobium terrae]THF50686.1 hypothetical protein E6C51_07435 [Allorhizobium terrae]
MTVELNRSPAYATKAPEARAPQIERERGPVVGLSLAEEETINLARQAETGQSLWDKVILNLVRPPSITLFALLDSGRKVAAPPLPQVQEAYDSVANTAKELSAKASRSETANPDADTTSPIAKPEHVAVVPPAPAAPSHTTAQAPAQTSVAQTVPSQAAPAVSTAAPILA